MAEPMVKDKVGKFKNFSGRLRRRLALVLPSLALLTFIASWAAIFPRTLVEHWYARPIFPKISAAAARFADAVSFSWFDIGIPLGLALLVLMLRRKRYLALVNLAAALYLAFFWSWALNYHRQPLASKVPFDAAQTKADGIDRLAKRAAGEINRLYMDRQGLLDEHRIRQEAAGRVRRVVAAIDGAEWTAASRIKTSWLVNPWFHVAGVDGVFNPFGHEPVVSKSLLDIERPFVMAHELAHVRGYPDEGEANLIALFATVMSDEPALQYSGWLTLWLYLRDPERDKLLDDGPRRDLLRIFDRARREQIPWIRFVQTAVLDLFLKANSVGDGVRSYAQVVVLAAGTEPYWDRFR